MNKTCKSAFRSLVWKNLFRQKKLFWRHTARKDLELITIFILFEWQNNDDTSLREVEIMKKLNHKHILKLVGICTAESTLWIITEHFEQGDLRHYLESIRIRKRALPRKILMKMAIQISLALMYLQSRGIIHR